MRTVSGESQHVAHPASPVRGCSTVSDCPPTTAATTVSSVADGKSTAMRQASYEPHMMAGLKEHGCSDSDDADGDRGDMPLLMHDDEMEEGQAAGEEADEEQETGAGWRGHRQEDEQWSQYERGESMWADSDSTPSSQTSESTDRKGQPTTEGGQVTAASTAAAVGTVATASDAAASTAAVSMPAAGSAEAASTTESAGTTAVSAAAPSTAAASIAAAADTAAVRAAAASTTAWMSTAAAASTATVGTEVASMPAASSSAAESTAVTVGMATASAAAAGTAAAAPAAARSAEAGQRRHFYPAMPKPRQRMTAAARAAALVGHRKGAWVTLHDMNDTKLNGLVACVEDIVIDEADLNGAAEDQYRLVVVLAMLDGEHSREMVHPANATAHKATGPTDKAQRSETPTGSSGGAPGGRPTPQGGCSGTNARRGQVHDDDDRSDADSRDSEGGERNEFQLVFKQWAQEHHPPAVRLEVQRAVSISLTKGRQGRQAAGANGQQASDARDGERDGGQQGQHQSTGGGSRSTPATTPAAASGGDEEEEDDRRGGQQAMSITATTWAMTRKTAMMMAMRQHRAW